MNQAIQGDPSSTPPVLSAKRKRGRPRKDQSVNRMAITAVPPGFGGVKENQTRSSYSIDDGIVGQAVTGIVEAAFDAGYLLTVRIGNSDTNFRGVVFKPGHYLPVTAENDVAPHVQMIRRNEIHMHGKNQSRTGTAQNGSSLANHLHLSTQRTTNKSKGKYAAAAALSVHPVGARGTVVPVVLQPASTSNGTNQAPQGTSSDLDDDAVHTVEPLAMLPPDALRPTRQVHVAHNQSVSSQPYTGQQVTQGSAPNEIGSFNAADKGGQEEADKPVKTADVHTPDELTKGDQVPSSEMLNKDGKAAGKSLSKESNVFQDQPFQVIHSDVPQSMNVPQPLESYRTGRMTELLLALQENMTDNQAANANYPSSSSESDDDEDSRD